MKQSIVIVLVLTSLTSAFVSAQTSELSKMPLAELQARVKSGEPEAMVQLATRYHMGTGVPQDNARYGSLMDQAAKAGADIARGYCARYGRSQPRNRDLAFSLFQKAADRGEPLALCYLADCNTWGHGTKRDLPKAHALLEQATASGEPEVIAALAKAQFFGTGTVKSEAAALATLLSAKDSGSAAIAQEIADNYWKGYGTERDEAQAEHYALLALKGGMRSLFDEIIKSYSQGPGISKANALLRRAGEQGDAGSWLKLAENHGHGRGTEQNPTLAHECFLKAGDLGDGSGYYQAALDFQNGRGVPQNEDRAKAIFGQAAALGHVEARRFLTRQGPPAPVEGDFVPLAASIRPPAPGATSAERFLHQLTRITTRYLLDSAYRPATGSTLNDLDFAEWRANSIVALLRSPIGQEAPADLRVFCKRALELDAAFLMARSVRYPPPDQNGGMSLGKFGLGAILAMAADMEADGSRATQPWLNSNTPVNQHMQAFTADFANNTLLPAMRRVEKSNQLLEEARALQQVGGWHQRWADLLNTFAASDASLKPYAADPRISDPTWHFAALRDLGETYFGQSITSRGEGEQSEIRRQAPTVDFGSPAEAPILIHIKSSGQGWAFQFGYNDPPNLKRAYVLTCTRGHIGAKIGMFDGLWAAQGMTSWGNDARTKFSSSERTMHLLAHLPVTGAESENEVEATLLIYLREDFPTADAAAAQARHLDLFALPHTQRSQ